MAQITQQEKYCEYLRAKIYPHVDFKRLQASYDGDRAYAKEVLREMHAAVKACYGTEAFDSRACPDSEGLVSLPGIVRGENTGKIALAVVDIDLTSSGEHYETEFLLDVGAVLQYPRDKALADRIRRDFIPYEYCYTPFVLDDHHVDFDELPTALSEMLNTFQNAAPRADVAWAQFDKAKQKAADAKAQPPTKTPGRDKSKPKTTTEH